MTGPVVERPSPNHDARGPGPVDMLVLHYTGMIDGASALARLTDPTAKVSAHYVIDEDGTIHRLVAEDRRAWHAGVACWRGAADINGRSIGIELVNPGHAFGYRPFPDAQMRAVIDLGLRLVARHPIPARNVVGHADVAPRRKEDPGELFDWRRLADHGLGLWPRERPVVGEMGLALGPGDGGEAVVAVQRALADYGYDVPTHGAFDADTEAVVRAFQRHFRPSRVDGRADPETAQLAFALQAMVG